MADAPIVTLFGSHNPKPGSKEYEEAEVLGRLLGEAGYRVGTGGYGGIMEAALKGAGGGIGFTADIFYANPNAFVVEVISSPTLFTRIETIIDRSNALVCLKGGTGTLLELAAAWELVNKKIVPYRPIICLGPFWQKVVATLADEPTIENLETLKNVDASASGYVHFVDEPEGVVRMLAKLLGGS